MTTRRDILKSGAGLAAILATGKAPAYIVKSMLAARNSIGMRVGGAKLPYDAEVEYLESTGTQWIVSDISFTSGHIVITGGAYSTFTESPNNFSRFFVGQSSSAPPTNDDIRIGFYWAQTIVTGYRTWQNIQGSAVSLDNPYFMYDLDTTTGTVYRKFGNYSGTVTNDRLKEASNGKPFVFFARGADGTGAYPTRIYYLRIEINGVLVRDFIPVRFTNELGQSEGAMYDRVSKRLFGNAGTGNFGYGNDK